ncbi:hypothetical protein Lal_00039951 [Lupinus albus]|nr:hypothetical protein Lal_00039951 [Lupinus albus]
MWDTLQVTHKGSSEVKRARLNALSLEYELFRMFPHESICDMQKRFTHIVNHIVALDKVFDIRELTNKVLRCLSRKWQPKVTAIMESKDVDSMSLATLFGKLQEHEMELQRSTVHEQTEENINKISFKATKSHSRSQEVRSDHEESDSDIDDETISHLVNKFRKFLRKKGGFRKVHKEDVKDSIKKSKNPEYNTSCHECGKVGDMLSVLGSSLEREILAWAREVHLGSDFGSSNVASFGSSNVASFGSSNEANFGSSNVASFGSSNVANFGSSNVASFGSSNVANFGSSYVAWFSKAGGRNMGVFELEH